MTLVMDQPTQAIVIGANGGIGAALLDAISQSGRFEVVTGLARTTTPALDLDDEPSIAEAADALAGGPPIRLLIIATGLLHAEGISPEKRTREIDPDAMARAFAINATGPALVFKHFLPLLPREGRSVVAAISAKVGSIGDNGLGGWHSYRASKAALNQIVKTCAIELARSHKDAVLAAIHPGTVDTRLSSPFARTGLHVQSPEDAAKVILGGLETLTPENSGGFFDRTGEPLPY